VRPRSDKIRDRLIHWLESGLQRHAVWLRAIIATDCLWLDAVEAANSELAGSDTSDNWKPHVL